MASQYEISAKLIIDNKQSKKAIKEAIKEIDRLTKDNAKYQKYLKNQEKQTKNTSKATEENAKSTDKLSRAVKANDVAYQKSGATLEKLNAGLGDNHKKNEQLKNDIKKTHERLKSENASVQKATEEWKKFAKQRGLVYRGGSLVSSSQSIGLIKNQSEALGVLQKRTTMLGDVGSVAFKDYTKRVAELNNALNTGKITQQNFHKGLTDTAKYMKGTYGVTVRQLGNGYSELTTKTSKAQLALNQYLKEMRTSKNLMRQGAFGGNQARALASARDTLGYLVMGSKYADVLNNATKNKEGIALNTLSKITAELEKNQKTLGVTKSSVTSLKNEWKSTNTVAKTIGGNWDSLANKTGNYNKLLTTTTRSQRMQNYAMQVAGLRYNALGTMVGFVGGMFAQQLAMGFATARIEAVKFEQQAQQMFKTSNLNAKSISNVTKAVREYTKENRKINTQGLEYTVAQVTKLNGLTEEQATKSIPVIADITNMMQINGRSQEDAILAVNDALDGQFKRLQEIGVGGKEMLKSYGWSGDVEDKMGLLNALKKIGEKKGWSDLTKDISTLDDAYKVLGNTIDDVLTPVMVKLTPIIVDVVQAISGFLSNLIDAPLPIQATATALLVLGTAFARMKFEMLYAKIIGSEFIARLTGLDDGMYGIKRSMGAVSLAVKDGALSFEEATRCAMDYHKEQSRALFTYAEYENAIESNVTLQSAYNAKLAETTAEINALQAEYAELSAEERLESENKVAVLTEQQEQLRLERETIIAKGEELRITQTLDQEYVRYQLAMENITAQQRIQLLNLQQRYGLTEAETAQIMIQTGAIDAQTGAIDLNTVSKKLGLDVDKMSRGEMVKQTAINKLYATGILRGSKATEAKTRAIYGLIPAQKLYHAELIATKTEESANAVATQLSDLMYQRLNSHQKKNIASNTMLSFTKGALNDLTEEEIALLAIEIKELQTEKRTLAECNVLMGIEASVTQAVNAELVENSIARKMANGGIRKWIINLIKSTGAMIKEAGAIALVTAEFLLLDPVGWAVDAVLIAIGATAYTLISRQMELNKVFGDFAKISEEVTDKLEKLNDKLKKTKDSGKKKEIEEEINQYKKLEKQINQINDKREERYERSLSKIRKSNEDMINTNRGRFGKGKIDYTGLEDAISEKEKINKYIGEFGDTVGVRNQKLNKLLEQNNISEKESTELLKGYGEAQLDVIDSMDKFDSEDLMTRLSGYWGNFWARLKMSWIETWANKGKNLKEMISNIWKNIGNWFNESFGSIDWGNSAKTLMEILTEYFNSATEMLNTIDFEGITNFLNSIVYKIGEWIEDNQDLIKQVINSFINLMVKEIEISSKALFVVLPKILMTICGWIAENPDVVANLLSAIGTLLQTLMTFIPRLILEGIASLVPTLVETGKRFGNNIHNGIVQGLVGLKNAVVNKLIEVKNYITSGQIVNDIINGAKQIGTKVVTEFGKGLGNMAKPVIDEINEICNTLANACKAGIEGTPPFLAYRLGKSIADKIVEGADRHSPGLAARAINDEMNDIQTFISDSTPAIEAVSKLAGQAVVDGFGDTDSIADNLNIIQNNQDLIKSNNLASQNTTTQYGNMANTVDKSFTEMSNNATTDMQGVANTNAQYLAKMNSDTTANMTTINKTNNDKLNNMQSTTLTATNSMTKAWGSMKNNIVNSATQIRNLSYQKFSSLHRSIASFYRQIQSATFNSGLPAGHYAGRSRKGFSTTRRSVSGGYAGHYSGRQDDDYLKLLKGLSRGTATNEDVLQFYNKYSIDCKGDDCYAGVNPSTHVNKQLNYAKGWNIKDPAMYGIRLPMSNKVKDFMNGNAPRITYGNFETYLGALLNERGFRGTYEFYFNSKRSNQQVWDDVRCNCFDGAELIMEIARDMGLSNVGMLHGDWKGIPHVCASVGGKIYDMTQFQDYGVFRGTAGVHFGGAGHTGKRIKWASHTQSAGHTTNNNNTKNNKIQITVTGNTFIGEEEYKKKMESIAEDVFYDKMSDNPCIGY